MVDPRILWLILLSPLAAACAVVLFFLGRHRTAGWVCVAGVLVSFTGSVNLFWENCLHPGLLPAEVRFPWLRAGGFTLDFGFLVDPLTVLMLLVVTGVGSLIFLYSIGYMKGDPGFSRYFACLGLFAFSMTGIVLADNFLSLFVFWELVAVSSYLLIGFWFEKPSAADAGNKAFLVNRLADFGFLLGILLIWALSGAGAERTLSFSKLAEVLPARLEEGLISQGLATAAALLIFCGVAGKSAQFPLYIWLPDAMEGPTPVSALIHAATMVAAGIFLMARAFFILDLSPFALSFIAAVGGATALLAALLALVQSDIKKILAYSTVSQLGFMAMGLGLGSAEAGMFHLVTHAFFKALLFLGAGALIHSLHTQEIWEMGATYKEMPVTSLALTAGSLALAGLWPLSGFFSKDAILALAFEKNALLFGVGIATSALTAFYITRLLWVSVWGARKKSDRHAHEAPRVMTVPLIFLSLLSIGGGFFPVPEFLSGHAGHHPSVTVLVWALGAATLGIALGTAAYAKVRTASEDPLLKIPRFLRALLVRKYFLDDFFSAAANFFQRIVGGIFFFFDARFVIGTLVNGSAGATRSLGGWVRKTQTGRIQNYAGFFLLGLLVIAGFCAFRL